MPSPTNAFAEKLDGVQEHVNGFRATWFRRALIRVLGSTVGRFAPSVGNVSFVLPGLCIKYGLPRRLSEAEAMACVAKHTSIPVPKIFCAFTHRGVDILAMERIKGTTLREAWPTLSDSQRHNVLSQLRRYISELRAISAAKPGHVGSALYNPLHDDRLPFGGNSFGPFDSTTDFHTFLRSGINIRIVEDGVAEGKEIQAARNKVLEMHSEKAWPTRFTHGDLSSFNIMIKDGEVTGIIDWATAGWYPDYWEYTNAWHVNPYDEWWRGELDRFLQTYPAEMEMEKLRRRVYGRFGLEW